MKKVTELSKFAIKLGEVNNYISKSKIDFLKISDQFKQHSHNLVRDLSNLLDIITPQRMSDILNNIQEENRQTETADIKEDSVKEPAEVKYDDEQKTPEPVRNKKSESEELKESYIFDELKENEEESSEFNFEKFEKQILKPIKELDSLLKRLSSGDYSEDELDRVFSVMKENAELSHNVGFEIIHNMHKIFAHSIRLIRQGYLDADEENIESMRACLIVVVAVVRGKEVDITDYLNRAEMFGRKVLTKYER
jgi:flagellin-specific chaperone FliS